MTTLIDTDRDPLIVVGGGLAGLYATWRLTQVRETDWFSEEAS